MTQIGLVLPQHDGERLEERDDIGRLTGVVQQFGAADSADLPRIAIAVDGTEVSLALIDRALEWRQQHQWQFAIHLLWAHPFVAKEVAERQLESNGQTQTQAVCAHLATSGLAYTLHLIMGNPAASIVRRAAELNARMILMGTRGHGPIGSALLGSVANRVVQEASIPVALVRA